MPRRATSSRTLLVLDVVGCVVLTSLLIAQVLGCTDLDAASQPSEAFGETPATLVDRTVAVALQSLTRHTLPPLDERVSRNSARVRGVEWRPSSSSDLIPPLSGMTSLGALPRLVRGPEGVLASLRPSLRILFCTWLT